jgi:uncharacterized protein YkwD
MPVRALFAAVLPAVAALACAPAAHAAHAPIKGRSAQTCANADLVPAASNLRQVRAAILCLHNQVRGAHGRATVRENRALDAAALGHSDDMVARHYFDHTAPDGGTFVQRILAAGFARRNQAWTIGENLAWGTQSLSSPAGLMDAWMHSKGHRENILKGAYREIGIGIQLGTPDDPDAGATISIEFGVKG